MENSENLANNPHYRDHLDKCRCCFMSVQDISDENLIKDWHREVFGLMIGIEMIDAPGLSTSLCNKCIKFITAFEYLSKKFLKLQNGYYEFMGIEVASEADDEVQQEESSDTSENPELVDLEEETEETDVQVINEVSTQSTVSFKTFNLRTELKI